MGAGQGPETLAMGIKKKAMALGFLFQKIHCQTCYGTLQRDISLLTPSTLGFLVSMNRKSTVLHRKMLRTAFKVREFRVGSVGRGACH